MPTRAIAGARRGVPHWRVVRAGRSEEPLRRLLRGWSLSGRVESPRLSGGRGRGRVHPATGPGTVRGHGHRKVEIGSSVAATLLVQAPLRDECREKQQRQTLHPAAEVGGKAGRHLQVKLGGQHLLSDWLYSCFFLPEVTDFRPCRETCNEFCNGSRVPRRARLQPRAPRAAPSRPGQRLATPRRHGVHQWRGAELQRPAASGGSRQAQSIRECFSGAAPGFRSAALSGQHGPIACLGRLLLPNVARARLVAS